VGGNENELEELEDRVLVEREMVFDDEEKKWWLERAAGE
jgi:hypothetical protein